MTLLLTDRYGKISAGMWDRAKGKKPRTQSVAPFSRIHAVIVQRRNSYDLIRAEIEKSNYELGEDVDKYLYASYALELTDQAVSENVPVPEVFELLSTFLDMLTVRKSSHLTLLIGYELHLMRVLGTSMETSRCVRCGSTEKLQYISVSDGGVICENCHKKLLPEEREGLIYMVDFGIIKTIEYYKNHGLRTFEKVALKDDQARLLQGIVRQFMAEHLDIRHLRSEGFLDEEVESLRRS